MITSIVTFLSIVTVCQTVVIEMSQIIVTVTVQPPSGDDGDDLRR